MNILRESMFQQKNKYMLFILCLCLSLYIAQHIAYFIHNPYIPLVIKSLFYDRLDWTLALTFLLFGFLSLKFSLLTSAKCSFLVAVFVYYGVIMTGLTYFNVYKKAYNWAEIDFISEIKSSCISITKTPTNNKVLELNEKTDIKKENFVSSRFLSDKEVMELSFVHQKQKYNVAYKPVFGRCGSASVSLAEF